MPTLLDLMGLPGPASLDGVSLAETVAGRSEPPDRPVFCQYSGNPTLGDIRRTVIAGRWKYTYTPGDAVELYDLADDPLETENLGQDPRRGDLIADLHSTLASWGIGHGDWVTF